MEFAYESRSQSFATKFLTSQGDALVLATRPPNSQGTRFMIGEFSVHNRSGSICFVGMGGRFPISLWSLGVWDESEYAAGTVYASETTDAQSAATGDVNLDTVTTNGDGIIIGCDVPFNIASIQVSQASSAGTVWQMYYSITTAGTGFSSNFTEITNSYVAPSFGTTGERLVWFEPPTDWVKASSATSIINRHGLTVPSQYLLVIKSTTAPDTTRGQMSLATLGRIFMSAEGIPDNGVLTNIGGMDIALPPQCDAICAAISTANPQNRVDLKYRYSG